MEKSSELKQEHYFVLKDGLVVKDLEELQKTMKSMSKETYSHHVTREKNDFYNWIKFIHKENKLSREILKADNPKQMGLIIANHLTNQRMKKALIELKLIEKAKAIPNYTTRSKLISSIKKAFEI
ncbi:hypothetical protein HYV50_01770 [Candidatus Pacearchaeota archaeon]|nr:hypothetical protein [Candidatus Pacearchaeota archaeon]